MNEVSLKEEIRNKIDASVIAQLTCKIRAICKEDFLQTTHLCAAVQNVVRLYAETEAQAVQDVVRLYAHECAHVRCNMIRFYAQ